MSPILKDNGAGGRGGLEEKGTDNSFPNWLHLKIQKLMGISPYTGRAVHTIKTVDKEHCRDRCLPLTWSILRRRFLEQPAGKARREDTDCISATRTEYNARGQAQIS